MQQNEISSRPAAPSVRLPVAAWRRPVAQLAAIALVLVCVPLATPGSAMVPGSTGLGNEDWATGIFGDGLINRPGVYLALLYVAIALWIVVLSFARDLGLRWIGWVTGILIVLFVAGPAAALPRRLQLHLLCATRRRSRSQSLRVRAVGAAAA